MVLRTQIAFAGVLLTVPHLFPRAVATYVAIVPHHCGPLWAAGLDHTINNDARATFRALVIRQDTAVAIEVHHVAFITSAGIIRLPGAVFRAGLNFNTSITCTVGGIVLIAFTLLSACVPSGVGRARIFGVHTGSPCGIHHIPGDAAAAFVIHAVRVGGTARGIGAAAIFKFDGVGWADTIAIFVNAVFRASWGFNAQGVVFVPNMALIALAGFFRI